jgi:hypothetical protein
VCQHDLRFDGSLRDMYVAPSHMVSDIAGQRHDSFGWKCASSMASGFGEAYRDDLVYRDDGEAAL